MDCVYICFCDGRANTVAVFSVQTVMICWSPRSPSSSFVADDGFDGTFAINAQVRGPISPGIMFALTCTCSSFCPSPLGLTRPSALQSRKQAVMTLPLSESTAQLAIR